MRGFQGEKGYFVFQDGAQGLIEIKLMVVKMGVVCKEVGERNFMTDKPEAGEAPKVVTPTDTLAGVLTRTVERLKQVPVKVGVHDKSHRHYSPTLESLTLDNVASGLHTNGRLSDASGYLRVSMPSAVITGLRVAFAKAGKNELGPDEAMDGNTVAVGGGISLTDVHNVNVAGYGLHDALQKMTPDTMRAAAQEAIEIETKIARMPNTARPGVRNATRMAALRDGPKTHDPASADLTRSGNVIGNP